MVSPIEMQKPNYKLGEEVQPEQRIFCVFKVVNVAEKEVKEGEVINGKGKYIVTLGDKTGTLKLFLKDEKFVKICKENTYVEVLNAHSKFYKGFIQIEMDFWANLIPCTDDALIKSQTEPLNLEKDHSGVEYELVQNETTPKGQKA